MNMATGAVSTSKKAKQRALSRGCPKQRDETGRRPLHLLLTPKSHTNTPALLALSVIITHSNVLKMRIDSFVRIVFGFELVATLLLPSGQPVALRAELIGL